ncbi:MAG: hypothetical protein FJ265_10395 [Planctomycetes bacterium]|nr:hypothetical protein [Planctomycetota bacterium]
MPDRRPLGFVLWFAAALCAQAPGAPSAAPARAVHGRLERLGGLDLLRTWGSPRERGYAHGFLLGPEVARVAAAEFTARFRLKRPLLQLARDAVARLVAWPDDVRQELEGLHQGLLDRKVDLRLPVFDRDLDLTDLLVANALDVFGLMGCSGFTVWGEQADGGGVLTARNFDWPFTGAHLVDTALLCVAHVGPGRAVCSVTWPGYVATVTGINRDGVAAFLHTGSARITVLPEPESWPSAVAARRILEELRPQDGAAAFAEARRLLGHTSPPAGFLTRVVLPLVPQGRAPAALFETNHASCVLGEGPVGSEVVTNHFLTRTDGRPPMQDSLTRAALLREGLARCLADGDHRMGPEEAWAVLATVQRGGRRHGTLHALVFRHEPWCFELRIGEAGPKGCVPAPSSGRRHPLTRAQVFGEGEPGAR